MAKKAYNIVTDYMASGNKAIDGCASCIIWHRKRFIALKSINLKEPYYSWFKKGVELLGDEQLEDETPLFMDKVAIEKGNSFQKSIILPQLWPKPIITA